jgi:hypothetical protein
VGARVRCAAAEAGYCVDCQAGKHTHAGWVEYSSNYTRAGFHLDNLTSVPPFPALEDDRDRAKTEGQACVVCPQGQFQPQQAQLSCIACPAGKNQDQNAEARASERLACATVPADTALFVTADGQQVQTTCPIPSGVEPEFECANGVVRYDR